MKKIKRSEFYLLDKLSKLYLDIFDYYIVDNDYLDLKTLKKAVLTRMGISVLSLKEKHKDCFENGRNLILREDKEIYLVGLFIEVIQGIVNSY